MTTDIYFWRLPRVTQAVGLSKTEIYRRISIGDFPAPRPYPGTRKKFWLSTEVREWQDRILYAPGSNWSVCADLGLFQYYLDLSLLWGVAPSCTLLVDKSRNEATCDCQGTPGA